MNKDQVQGKWHQVKGAIKARWGKLADDDIEQVNGNLEKLAGLLQEKYGYARDQAQKEVDDFKRRQVDVEVHTRP